jgi:hypothetical protein
LTELGDVGALDPDGETQKSLTAWDGRLWQILLQKSVDGLLEQWFRHRTTLSGGVWQWW